MAAVALRSQVTLRGTWRSTVPGSAPITTAGSPKRVPHMAVFNKEANHPALLRELLIIADG